MNSTTSVTHQLHCLYTILNAYNTMLVTFDSPLLQVNPIQQPWHVNHCFEYIGQAIMCAGDVALEGGSTSARITLRSKSTWKRKRSTTSSGYLDIRTEMKILSATNQKHVVVFLTAPT